ncbi:MAG: cupin domain-containing protein [bacterium]|jgi:mannose-6-phosphate isomerase-like protein (cupin superfamily)
MRDQSEYPYVTILDVRHKPLEIIDLGALADACPHEWYNETLAAINGSVVRLGVVRGEYHWHKHERDDEFFYVVEGKLLIDIAESGDAGTECEAGADGVHARFRTIELAPRQGFVVLKGVVHRTRAEVRTVILMVENAGIIPTGD